MILDSKPGGGAEQALNVASLVKTSLKKKQQNKKNNGRVCFTSTRNPVYTPQVRKSCEMKRPTVATPKVTKRFVILS